MHLTAFVICHRLEHLVDRAVGSLRAQSVKPDRIILVGTDCRPETRAAFAHWAMARVETIYSERALTCAESKNFCGEYATNMQCGAHRVEDRAFFTLDADDYVHPRYVEHCFGHMQQSGADVVGCDYLIDDRHGWLRPASANQTPIDRIAERNPLPACSIIRLSAWRESGGYDGSLKYEDWALWLTLYCKGFRLYRYPMNLFTYVQHGNNLTNGYDWTANKAQIDALYQRLNASLSRLRVQA